MAYIPNNFKKHYYNNLFLKSLRMIDSPDFNHYQFNKDIFAFYEKNKEYISFILTQKEIEQLLSLSKKHKNNIEYNFLNYDIENYNFYITSIVNTNCLEYPTTIKEFEHSKWFLNLFFHNVYEQQILESNPFIMDKLLFISNFNTITYYQYNKKTFHDGNILNIKNFIDDNNFYNLLDNKSQITFLKISFDNFIDLATTEKRYISDCNLTIILTLSLSINNFEDKTQKQYFHHHLYQFCELLLDNPHYIKYNRLVS